MSQYWQDRGKPWDFDRGPAHNRSWARLFAETPNYRGLSEAVLGSEKFRWHFGPMFYRGRLTDNDVKVLVIGQEGAQDESLAHRSFTGGTGARMQHFLHHIGITESYLFLNTFVYPIFGEYFGGPDFQWLAQDPASPIVKHRHEIFDYVLARNDLRLLVAVGNAAKDSVITWVESHGGTCPGGRDQVETCTCEVLGTKTKCVGVVHPGSQSAALVDDFKAALQEIENWANADPSWLPADPGGQRKPWNAFVYDRAPIPFRDFPLGVAWRLGRGGTSSNRRDSQRAIQIFSAGGRYNGAASYGSSPDGSTEGYQQEPNDLAYEPPRESYRDYDRGPSQTWARLLMGGRTGFEWPDFGALGVTSHESLGWGPIYRGRTSGAKALILADQRSHDDLFLFRAATGDQGQHLQALLKALGLPRSYLILRVLPVDTSDLTQSKRNAIVDDAQVRKVYAEICRYTKQRNAGLRFAMAIGSSSRRLAPHVLPAGLPLIEMQAYPRSGWKQSWLAAQTQIQAISYEKDEPASFAWNGERGQIPRYDLPYGTLRWQGTSDDRAQRGEVGGNSSPDYYKISLPKWTYELDPKPLTRAESDGLP